MTGTANHEIKKIILFTPINSAGHMNASLAIADRLRQDHSYRSIFLLIGPPITRAIERHGHELLVLEDMEPYEDYELEEGEDPDGPVDEERKRAEGRSKKRFVGAFKWPQMIARNQSNFQMEPLDAIKHTSHLVRLITLNNLRSHETQISEAIERLQPRLIIADIYLPPACILINETRRPWVRIHTANPLICCESKLADGVRPPANCGLKLYTREERLRMRAQEPQKWNSIVGEWRRAHEEISQTLDSAYAPVREWYAGQSESLRDRFKPGTTSINSAHLNIYMYPKALDYDQEDDLFEYPARWLRCDSLVRQSAGRAELAEEQRWQRLLDENMADKEAMIFFSLGSIASGNVRLMQRYVDFLGEDAARGTSRRLYVVSKGVNGNKYELASSDMIGESYVPQTLLLRRASLAIVHGGNNTITECLYYGVPMIVMPNFADQSDNAQRVEDLGFGKRLDLYKCTKDELLQTIDALLDNEPLIERVREIGKWMQGQDELGKVSDVIGRLVERGDLDELTSEKYAIKLA